jgi:zinc transport system substrate-binding protein
LTGCLHDYQLTPGDMTKLTAAKLLVINGAGMESFMDQALGRAPGIAVVNASEGIALLKGAEGSNPHVWVSVALAIKQVQNIAAGLARADAANAEAYRRNAEAYVARLEALRARMRAELQSVGSRQIVTFHEAFAYFAAEFDLRVAAVIEREPGSQPSAGDLARTIAIVRAQGVKAVFAEPQYPAAAAEAIARETGLRVFKLDPAVTGPVDQDAYIRTMEANLAVLKEALK